VIAFCACVWVGAGACTRADQVEKEAEPGAVVVASPTAEPTLTLDQLIEAHAAALGGRALLQEQDTIYYEVVAEDGSGTTAVYRKRPALLRREHPDGLVDAYDGESGWYQPPTQPPAVLAPEKLPSLRRSAAFDDPLLDCGDPDATLQCRLAGRARIPEGLAWEIELSSEGAPMIERRYLSAASYLEVRRTYQAPSQDAPATAVTFSDYAPVDGLMVNGAYAVHHAGQVQRYRIEAADYGREMPDELFQLGRNWLWGWSATPVLDEDSVNPLPPSANSASRPPPPPPSSGHGRI
jgi:hypothetical protein